MVSKWFRRGVLRSCGAFSEHGYAGIEEKVVDSIAKFIRGEDKH